MCKSPLVSQYRRLTGFSTHESLGPAFSSPFSGSSTHNHLWFCDTSTYSASSRVSRLDLPSLILFLTPLRTFASSFAVPMPIWFLHTQTPLPAFSSPFPTTLCATLCLYHVFSSDQVVDIFIKGASNKFLQNLICKLGICDIFVPT